MTHRRSTQLMVNAAIILLLIPTLFPLYFTLGGSLKDPAQFITNLWGAPTRWVWDNHAFAWAAIGRYVFNSVVVSAAVVSGVIALGSMAAYALAWGRFRGRLGVLSAMIAPMMVPGVLTLVPLFLIVRDLGLLNSYGGLVLPQIAGLLPLSVLLLYRFFSQVPRELMESARLDGAGELRVLRSILLPLSMPAVATVAILTTLASWNNYLWPLVCIRDESLRTVPLGVAFASHEFYLLFRPGREFAIYVAASLPLLLVFLIAMGPFMRGLSAGAVKG